MGNENLRYYQFGEFKLDSRRRILFKNDSRIDISAKNFELLYFLIQNEGRILSHDEILDTVWHGIFVEQSNLKKGISALRHLLDETPNESLYIKTIPRQGYSFVAPVVGVPDDADGGEIYARGSQTEIYIEEIEEIIDDEEPQKALSPAPATGSSKLYLAVAAMILIPVIVAIGLWRYLQTRPVLFNNVRIEKLATDGSCHGRMSLDNNFLACTIRLGETGSAIEIHQVLTGDRRRLVEFSNSQIYANLFSFDGNFIFFVLKNFSDDTKSGIYKMSILGGEPKMILSNAGSMAVSSTGTILFTRSKPDGGAQVILVDANGQNERVVTDLSTSFRIWDFRFSPGEKTVLLSLRKQITDQKNVFYVSEISLDDGTEKIVVPERDTLIANAVWMPDMQSLLLCVRETNADIRQIWQYFVSSGEMVRITNDNTSYKDIQILKDGRTISAVTENIYSNIWVGDGEKGDFHVVTTGFQTLDRPFWTRDGRIGYSAVENSSEVIRIMSEDGNSRERVNEGKDGYWIQPSLGGNGQTIAYNSNHSGLDQLWRIGVDGKNPAQVTRSESPVFNGRLLSDGTAVYKTFAPTSGWQLMKQSPNGETAKIDIPDINTWDVSPDEKSIATIDESTQSGSNEIVIYDLKTFAKQKSLKIKTSGGFERLAWDRDAKGFTYAVTDKGTSEIYRISVDGNGERKVTDFRYERIFWFDWSFDGTKLAVVRGRSFRDPVILRPSV